MAGRWRPRALPGGRGSDHGVNSPRAFGVKGTRTSDREGTVSSLVDIAGGRPAIVDTTAGPAEVQLGAPTRYLLAGIRVALGWVFLWAFLDKPSGWAMTRQRPSPG